METRWLSFNQPWVNADMRLKIIVINIIITILLLLHNLPVIAAGPTSTSTQGLGCGGNMGPIAEFLCKLTGDKEAQKEEVGNKLNTVIGSIIGFLTIVSALWFFIQFIIAGFSWISAGGDKTALENARKKLMNSVIGITIVAAAWVIVGVIGTMLGLDILDPGAIMQTIGL